MAAEKGGGGGAGGAAVPTRPARRRSAAPRCPVCGKPSMAEHRPFCSPRCAQIDLGRWLTGSYAIPAEEEPDPGFGTEDETGQKG